MKHKAKANSYQSVVGFRLLVAALMIVWLNATPGMAASVHVADFGAIPDDGVDDTIAIQNALTSARKPAGQTVVFSPGVYDVSAKNAPNLCLIVVNAENLVLEGNGALLRVHSWVNALLIENANRITVRGLSFDWDPLPFVQARIARRESSGVVLDLVAPAPALQVSQTVTSMFEYDEAKQRPASRAVEWFFGKNNMPGLEPIDKTTTLIKHNLGTLPVGSAVVLRLKTYGAQAVMGINSANLQLEDVSVFSAPGMAIVMTGCENVTIARCRVAPPEASGRWISTCADALHFTMCRGTIAVQGCTLSQMGDDGLNANTLAMKTSAGTRPEELLLTHGKSGPEGLPEFRSGDMVAFSRIEAPYQEETVALVAAASPGGLRTPRAILFDRPLPAWIQNGCIAINRSAIPKLRVQDTQVRNNRARGFWLQVEDVVLEGCTVEGSSGPALEVRCDVNKWWEGTPARRMRVLNSSFSDCNYGPARGRAFVNIYAQLPGGVISKSAVHHDFSVEKCKFSSGSIYISIESASRMSISGTTFDVPVESAIYRTEPAILRIDD
jgi:hypothetical protein